VKALSDFRERYSAKGFNRSDAQQLVEFVDDWLARHIGRIDTQLKLCVEKS
jgi:hemerythrin